MRDNNIEDSGKEICEVQDAEYAGGHRLRLWFNDGMEGEVDLSDNLKGVFDALKDVKVFKQFGLSNGVISWPGELDIAPEYLYKRVLEAKGIGQSGNSFKYFSIDSW